MLRRSVTTLASKSSGTNATYQARPPRRKPKQFHVYLNGPVSTREYLKEQRCRYNKLFERTPEYFPGANVSMNPKTYTLKARCPGIVHRTQSKINPALRSWLHVDPDVQKHRRSREVRKELLIRGEASELFRGNQHYDSERHDATNPHWRAEVQRVPKMTEQFKDPNLLTKGLLLDLRPLQKYTIV